MTLSAAVIGEFVGTAILILLGNGVVGGVLLSKSKAENAGWVAITAGWGLAVFSGVAVAISIGDTDAHLNPAFTVASVLMTGHAERITFVHTGADSRRDVGRLPGVAFLSAALGRDRRCGQEACLFFHRPGDSQLR